MKLKSILTSTILAATATTAGAQLPLEPDFAKPRDVIAGAERVLNTSTGIDRMQALMQILCATQSVTPDSVYTFPARIEKLAREETSPVVSGLLSLYAARSLAGIYQENSYKYNNVDAPALPLPADVQLWSADQFRSACDSLINTAVSMVSKEWRNPLSQYEKVVSADATTLRFYPAIYDFVVSQGATIYRMLGQDDKARALYKDMMGMYSPGSVSYSVAAVGASPSPDYLLKIYREQPQGESAAYILYNMTDVADTTQVRLLRSYLDANQPNRLTGALRARLTNLTLPTASVTFSTLAVPGETIPVVVNHSYARQAGIAVYRQSSAGSGTSSKVGEITIEASGDQYQRVDTIHLTLDNPGCYMIYAMVDGKTRKTSDSNAPLLVTPYAPIVFGHNNNYALSLADLTTGAPVAGADIVLSGRRGGKSVSAGKTAPDGFTTFRRPSGTSDDWSGYDVSAVVAGRTYDFGKRTTIYFGRYNEDAEVRPYTTGTFYLDRPIYRPGDDVAWSFTAVTLDTKKARRTLAAHRDMRVVMYDANGQPVDTLAVTTDEYGRAYGSFGIPADRLSGRFSLRTYEGNDAVMSTRFMVSDFKAPVFEVTDAKASRDTDGTVTITGRATTYSGMPVAGAKVAAAVSERPRWWRMIGGNTPIVTVDGLTGADGSFTVTVPAGDLTSGTDYVCRILVTDAAAETAQSECSFTTGTKYILRANIADTPVNIDDLATLDVKAYAADGQAVRLPVRWTLTDGTRQLSGEAELDSDGLSLGRRDIPAGIYTLTVIPADSALCQTLQVSPKITIYSMRADEVPAGCDWIIPVKAFEAAPGETVAVKIGVPADTYIYNVLFTEKGIIRKSMQQLHAGFNTVEVKFPADAEAAKLFIASCRDSKTFNAEIAISKTRENPVTLRIETWRDNIVPGSRETLTLHLATADGSPLDGALVATMYNHALDALQSTAWYGSLPSLAYDFYPQFSALWSQPYSDRYTAAGRTASADFELWAPVFRYMPALDGVYHMTGGLRIRGTRMLAQNAVMTDMKMSATTEAAEEAAVPGAAPAEAGGAAPAADDDAFTFRDGEVLQALWCPALTFDKGSATITFDVPDANAAWTFRAQGWTADARSAGIQKLAVSSKPVMVQPNTPRFLREGDRATMAVTVYNRTDSASSVRTEVEVYDPATMDVYSRTQYVQKVDADASAVSDIEIDVPAGVAMIAFKVKSVMGAYADGEQNIIPVLPAASTVVESDNFVLTPARPDFSVELPGTDVAVMALQYCQNPVWDVVRSLPDVLNLSKSPSSMEAATALFGAYTAEGLLRSYPEIGRVVAQWQANPADSAFVSRLMLNDDIKTALLEQTPWVQAAASDDERMARLAVTFDAARIARTRTAALKALAGLQQPDGGFAWGSWQRESSLWITCYVLSSVGRLHACGYFPADGELPAIVEKALAYCDRNVKADDPYYSRVLSLYPSHKPSTLNARKALDSAVQTAARDWQSASVAGKARAALLLEANGYHNTALEIIASLRQFMVIDSATGEASFPSVKGIDVYCTILEAFAKIDPRPAEIDAMRMWLVMKTQYSSDLGAWTPTMLISSILSTGSDWTSFSKTSAAAVTVGGTALDINPVQYATGAFSARLPLADAGKRLRVVRDAAGPISYGSLTTVSTRRMTDIKPASCDELAIEKRFLVNRDGEWVETTAPAFGQQVRVQLILRVADNLQYVTITDERAAALEPVDQLPGYVYASGLGFYREQSDAATRLFISYLPKGTYYLTYDMTVALSGTFASGIATAQSQYAPQIVAHSAGHVLNVSK